MNYGGWEWVEGQTEKRVIKSRTTTFAGREESQADADSNLGLFTSWAPVLVLQYS